MNLTKQEYSDSLYKIFRAENFKEIINFPPSFGELGKDGQRILLHFQGMAFAALGAPQKAKLTYLKALNYGENIQLLRDLSCTYYQLEEYQAWRDTYQKLHQRLQEFTKNLDFDSRFTSSLTLAKFFEEEGCFGQALSVYERLSLYSQAKSPQRYFYLLAPQLLRLKSQLPVNEDLSRLYTQLLSYNQNEFSTFINIEIEHSLMLAEVNLIGFHHAWSRVVNLLDSSRHTNYDKRLFYIDFLEEAILHKYPLKSFHFKLENEINDEFSRYENEVVKLSQLNNSFPSQGDVYSVARDIPMGSYLKLLNLYATKVEDEIIRDEFKNKINLIISGFNTEDRTFWIKRAQKFNKNSFTELTIDSERRSVNFQKKFLDVSRKKQALQLLKLLADKPKWTVDEAIDNIWQSAFTPEHFNRLRMTVHRTNILLQELTTQEKCIEISGESLSLSPGVKLVEALHT
ncbi:MAG: hypothetical protein H6625_08200 [Bdellovibrionaceae bacterium]|nr:hypothetical protein [Pseudobdellovibrionaceae bacterium]